MSYFCGFNNLVISIFLIIIYSSSFLIGTCTADHDENQLFGSYSLEELAAMAGYGEEKLSTVLVTGSVHCEACLHASQLHAWPVSGAQVAVNCHINGKKGKSSWIKGVTDEYGDFTIDLPSHLHAIPNLDRKCSVRVLRIPKNSLCRPAYVRRHKELRLSSVGNGIRTYDAGMVRFQHLASTTKQGCVRKERNKSEMLL
ncbi:Pollen Ole e 1 allergen and extensin family protein [Parasponia andersonii]|uniref:Pollen Ole e 1 allergen and extensin family protein n=1 Tax=Parasponia andersonii TaxID=3476 RepID=A0A2P5ANW2_PARAD|nr:Pollen Ole e 1 allergen and extensin family protein [Parasponia andersonii]